MAWKVGDPACSPFNQPDFMEDPGGYFDWVDMCHDWGIDIVVEDPPPPPCQPRRWIDARGCCWQVVCTDRYPEVVPCFDSLCQVTVPGAIQGLQLTGRGYRVRLATTDGFEIVDLEHGEVPLRQLAGAMVTGDALGGSLSEVDADRWQGFRDVFGPGPKQAT